MVLNELILLLQSRAVMCTSEPGRGQGYAGLPLGPQLAYQPSGVLRVFPQAHSAGQAELAPFHAESASFDHP